MTTDSTAPPNQPAPYALEDLHMIEATTPDLIQKTWANNWEEWAKGVEKPTYYEREIVLSKTNFSNNHKIRTWILVPKTFGVNSNKPDDLEQILSAVETYERPGIVATVAGGLQDVSSFSVASVYTPAKYRRHGYGSLLMRLLWEKMAELGGCFSFLYSDVGPTFYGQVGWTPRRTDEIQVQTSYALPPAPLLTEEPLEQITDDTLDSLVAHDHQMLRQLLQQRLTTLPSTTKTLVAVRPEPNCFRWLHTRGQFNAILKNPTRDPADLKIAVLGVKDPQSKDNFVIWYHDFFADQLLILRWRLTGEPETDPRLTTLGLGMIKACQDEARRWNLSKVKFWNPDETFSKLVGLKIETRPDSICSLGLVQVPAQEDPETVEWVLNEHYSW
ncbi:hypothetical protein BGZ52_001655 [Haplosporangium bisporale]|nr:hypothetical protein BGZ52_001655 [Haplosporangium bisporale]KAF9204801.1 hypothetical protein BGZ59_000858 [Podila verticillata]